MLASRSWGLPVKDLLNHTAGESKIPQPVNALIDPATQQPVPLGYYVFGAAIAALLGFISTHITLYCYNHCCENWDSDESCG